MKKQILVWWKQLNSPNYRIVKKVYDSETFSVERTAFFGLFWVSCDNLDMEFHADFSSQEAAENYINSCLHENVKKVLKIYKS